MKKNLRIVSAAAAALLAVAPIAASAVSTVNADAINNVTEIGNVPEVKNGAAVNIKPNITLNTSVPGTSISAALNASFTATIDGTTATSTFKPGYSSVAMWVNNAKGEKVKDIEHVNEITSEWAGTQLRVQLNHVTLNFGDKNANKDITLVLPNENGNHFTNDPTQTTMKTKTNENGIVEIPFVVLGVTAKDYANPTVVEWHNNITGATVNSGDLTLYAGSDAGKMNVKEVKAAIERKYSALSKTNTVNNPFTYSSEADITSQLKAQNIDVDAQGWFVAPKSFTVNYKATAAKNDASSALAVTVNVPNGKEAPVVNEVTKNVTIMHVAAIYDKNGKRTSEAKLGAYNSVSVVAEPVTINGAKFYKLAGKDEYIKVGNVDGTVRTLKHNSYKYKSNLKAYTHKVGKKTKKIVVKSGSEVKTYGSAFKMADGKMYYRIDKNTYIKKANF